MNVHDLFFLKTMTSHIEQLWAFITGLQKSGSLPNQTRQRPMAQPAIRMLGSLGWSPNTGASGAVANDVHTKIYNFCTMPTISTPRQPSYHGHHFWTPTADVPRPRCSNRDRRCTTPTISRAPTTVAPRPRLP